MTKSQRAADRLANLSEQQRAGLEAWLEARRLWYSAMRDKTRDAVIAGQSGALACLESV